MAVVLCGVPEPNFLPSTKKILRKVPPLVCPSVDIVQTQSQNRKSRALGEEREGQKKKIMEQGEEEEEESGGTRTSRRKSGRSVGLLLRSRCARRGQRQARPLGRSARGIRSSALLRRGNAGRGPRPRASVVTSRKKQVKGSSPAPRSPLVALGCGCVGLWCGDWGWVPNCPIPIPGGSSSGGQ